jgi:hypothetical protein
MPRPAPDDGLTKFQRYRTAKRQRGMKLLRIWVPDPRAPGFNEEARWQAAILRASPDEAEALTFIEATADLEGWR